MLPFVMPKLDVAQLITAIRHLQAEKPVGVGPGGHLRTGTKAFVRTHLDDILHARASPNATWEQVAAVLAARHGLRHGNGAPLSGRRLRALVSAVQTENRRKAAAALERAGRTDVASPPKPERPLGRDHDRVARLKLAPELAGPRSGAEPAPATEEQLRKANFDRHASLFKKD